MISKHASSFVFILKAKEFGSKMQGLLPSKDGKLVSYFESWRLPRKKGLDDKDVESWFEEKPN